MTLMISIILTYFLYVLINKAYIKPYERAQETAEYCRKAYEDTLKDLHELAIRYSWLEDEINKLDPARARANKKTTKKKRILEKYDTNK